VETFSHQLENSKHFKLSGNFALAKQPETCRRQLLAAVWQSEEADQVGRGLEHQLPQLYSHVGAIVVVQRATDEVVFVVVLVVIVVVGAVVGVMGGDDGVVVGVVVGAVVGVVVGAVVEVVEEVVDVEEDEVEEVVEVLEVLEEVDDVVVVVVEELELDTVEEVVEDEEVEDGLELDTGGEGLKLWHGWLDSRSVAT
jgi:hypothetical protein